MRKVLILLGLDLLLAALITLQWSGKIPTANELLPRYQNFLQVARQRFVFPPRLSQPPTTATSSAVRREENLRAKNTRLTQELTLANEKISQLKEQLKYSQDLNLKAVHPTYNYTGEDLFTEVNTYRRENNLGELSKDYNLCYLASFRLNQLLDLGKLDNHQGFDDFKPAEKFKYELVGENLAQGYTTASDVVYKGWVGSPGHHLLLSDPRLTLGCTAANRGLTVLIAGKEH